VGQTKHLKDAWRPGLQALRAKDRPHIAPEDPQQLQGSVDVDSALSSSQPNANRWDFAIAYQHSNRKSEFIYWVEIHTAGDKEVKVVLKKLAWLRRWLANDGKLLDQFECAFVWVSSGATTYTLDSPQRKRLAQLGLELKGRIVRFESARAT
jgi:hypothetical protein